MNSSEMRLFIIVISLLMLACDVSTKPYLKHEVELSYATGSCNEKTAMRVETNIIGERYHFQDCLQPGFSAKEVQVQRRGDTVAILYGRQSNTGQLVNFIVAIQTHPRYHFININGQTFPVVTAAY